MTWFHQTYQSFKTLSTGFSSMDLPWDKVDVQNDSRVLQLCATNGSNVELKFWDNSFLTSEKIQDCNKKDERKKAMQFLKQTFTETQIEHKLSML